MKVLVIGLDGGSLALLKPWAERGELPHLARLMAEGVTAELLSTLPAITPVAWTSFLTGKNPAKHCIFGFFRPPTSFTSPRYDRHGRPVSGTAIAATPLWRLLNARGIKVGFFNVPMTYPPPEVDGFVVSGFLTPSEDSQYTSPRELKAELLAAIPDFRVIPYTAHGRSKRFLEEVTYYTEKHGDAALWLLRRYQPDFMMAVFSGVDHLQHLFWSFMDPSHSASSSREAEGFLPLLKEFYRRLDKKIGELAEEAGGEATVMIMSDHGFDSARRIFQVNRWLHEQGWLHFRTDTVSSLQSRLLKMGLTQERLVDLLKKADLLKIRDRISKTRKRSLRQTLLRPLTTDVDWGRTRAYSGQMTEPFIYLNVQGREPEGIVEPGSEYETLRNEIIAGLSQLKDPKHGDFVFTNVFRREEIYSGPYLEWAPDIIYEFRKPSYYTSDVTQTATVFREEKEVRGAHAPEGIFLAHGPHLRRGENAQNPRIMDLAPTILHLFGLEVPRDLDGRVLQEIFDPTFLTSHTIRYEPPVDEELTSRQEEPLSREEEEKIRAMLQGLGYLG